MRMTEFTNAVTVCSGLGSILALVLLKRSDILK